MNTETTVVTPVLSGVTRMVCAAALLLTLSACGSSGGDGGTGSGSTDAGADSRSNETGEQNNGSVAENGGATGTVPSNNNVGSNENGGSGQVSATTVVLLGDGLWKTDGTAEGTVSVQDSINTVVAYYYGITEFNGEFYFQATDNVNGFELWKTNGMAAGTVLVKDINPGARSSFDYRFKDFTVFNGALYFHANDGVNGSELWKTDGTAAGTVLVKDINAAAGVSSSPSDFTVFNNTLYFSASDGVKKLWKTDGTVGGTTLVTDAPVGTGTSFLPDNFSHGFPVFKGALYFRSGGGLWKTDGITAPVQNEDIGTAAGWENYGYLSDGFTVFNDRLYVVATDTPHGREVWKTDTTAAGTVLLKDINTENGGRRSDYQFNEFTVFKGALYFQSKDNMNGYRLWKTDGTTDGMVLVKFFGLASPASALTSYNGGLYFKGTTGLWKSDGTADGTQLFKAF